MGGKTDIKTDRGMDRQIEDGQRQTDIHKTDRGMFRDIDGW